MSATLAPADGAAVAPADKAPAAAAVTISASAAAAAAATTTTPAAAAAPPAAAAAAAANTDDDNDPAIAHILFTAEQLAERVEQLARECARDYADKKPVLLTILKGGFIFAADFTRLFRPWPEGTTLAFVRARSYGARTETSGNVEVEGFDPEEFQGRHVLLLDDLSDSGLTLQTVKRRVLEAGALSAKSCVALDKAERRLATCEAPEYVGFHCPNVWVSGLGMDTNELYRGLGGGHVVVLSKGAQDKALGRG
jgi:hypoxanthine phosphoribosyltransferase